MNRVPFMVASLVFSAGLAGCFPSTYVTVPAFRGRVVDSAGTPIPNATVELQAARSDYKQTFSADSTGVFHRPEESQFFVYIIPEDMFLPNYEVRAKIADEQSAPVELHSGVRYLFFGGPSRKEKDLGDLRVLPRGRD